MKSFQVCLLGTPGCGKSEVYRRLADRLVREGLAREVLRIDDYPKVHETADCSPTRWTASGSERMAGAVPAWCR